MTTCRVVGFDPRQDHRLGEDGAAELGVVVGAEEEHGERLPRRRRRRWVTAAADADAAAEALAPGVGVGWMIACPVSSKAVTIAGMKYATAPSLRTAQSRAR